MTSGAIQVIHFTTVAFFSLLADDVNKPWSYSHLLHIDYPCLFVFSSSWCFIQPLVFSPPLLLSLLYLLWTSTRLICSVKSNSAEGKRNKLVGMKKKYMQISITHVSFFMPWKIGWVFFSPIQFFFLILYIFPPEKTPFYNQKNPKNSSSVETKCTVILKKLHSINRLEILLWVESGEFLFGVTYCD